MKIDALNLWILKYFTGAGDLLCRFCYLQNFQNRKLHEITLFISNLPVSSFLCPGDEIFFPRHFGIATECAHLQFLRGKTTVSMF